MKILLITLFAFSLVFYGIGFGVLVKALKTEDAEKKQKSNQFFAIGTCVFIVFFITLVIYLIWRFL